MSAKGLFGESASGVPNLTDEGQQLLVPTLIQLGYAKLVDECSGSHGLGPALLFAAAEPVKVASKPSSSSAFVWSQADLAALLHLRVTCARLELSAEQARQSAADARSAAARRLAARDKPGALHELRRSKALLERAAQAETKAHNASELISALLSNAQNVSFAAAMAGGTDALKSLQAKLQALVPGSSSAADTIASVLDAAANAIAEGAEVDDAIRSSGFTASAGDAETAELEAELASLMLWATEPKTTQQQPSPVKGDLVAAPARSPVALPHTTSSSGTANDAGLVIAAGARGASGTVPVQRKEALPA